MYNRFRIDGALAGYDFEGIDLGGSWNGASRPAFTLAVSLRIAAAAIADPDSGYTGVSFDGEAITLVGDDDRETFGPIDLGLPDAYFALGTDSWMWETVPYAVPSVQS